ncbi:MAG: hypothetical protein R3E74_12600 [Pseudomonadales bacterium]
MTEALLKHHASEYFDVLSAGTAPKKSLYERLKH